MNHNTFGIIWLALGIIGVVMFLWSELRVEKPREITLSAALKIPMLILAGPLTVAAYVYVWGAPFNPDPNIRWNCWAWKEKKNQ